MKVIIEPSRRGDSFKIRKVEPCRLIDLRQSEKYVEMDFELGLESRNQLPELDFFKTQSILLGTIGVKQLSNRVDALYEIKTGKLEERSKRRSLKETYWISCYFEERITASEYIACVEQLIKWAKLYQRPLIIYSQVAPLEKYYRYRSLTRKIINKLLEEVQGGFFKYSKKDEIAKYYMPSQKAFEFYIEKGIYLSCTYEEMMRRAINCLAKDPTCDLRQVYRMPLRVQSLYNDLFYEMIPDAEKIYVPFNEEGTDAIAYLNSLGIETIKGNGSYSLIYDRKDKINNYANEIKPYVIAKYECPILEREQVISTSAQEVSQSYKVLQGELAYRGRGVYIALINNSGIDYRLSTLRNADGTTRIAGMWYQTDGQEGVFYTKEQINAALQSENPEQIVPISPDSNQDTMLLNIAAGKDENYEGIATEAEILVAKVNTAPENLQKIYSGMFNAKNILMPELIVAIWKLQDFAKGQDKAIVFYVPYYTNIDTHDGFSFYNTLIAFVGVVRGSAIITPTGAEGNGRHHQTLYDGSIKEPIVQLQCSQDGQNIIGFLTQRYLNDWEVEVIGPRGQRIQIKQQGTYTIDSATVYSQGEMLNYYSGSKNIMFRISNMSKGTWNLQVNIQGQSTNRVDLWISGQQSNPYVTLFPQNPYVTIGSIGNIGAVTCVAGYNLDELTTLRNSGRGYTMDNRIKPTLAADGIIQTINTNREAVIIEGVEVSASVILGAAATIFEKWREENGTPLLNGVLLNSILLEYSSQFTNIPFPNPSQGYGIFEEDTLSKILLTPLNA